jgi:NADPH:quinone reductase-like Zn-dependent oxidoreductase
MQRNWTMVSAILSYRLQFRSRRATKTSIQRYRRYHRLVVPSAPFCFDGCDGRTAEKPIAKIKPGGVFASVDGAPQNAAKYPSVKVAAVFSKFDRKALEFMAEAVRDGKLVTPIGQELPLSEAAKAKAAAEKGGAGKILLVA